MRRGAAGYTIAELLVALVAGGMVLLALARMAETADRVGEAGRAGADARALQGTVERVLGRALEEAGDGIPSSPNLGGVGVRRGEAGELPADTLVVLSADGDAMAVAARGCRAAAPCVVLVGDRRAALAPGDLVVAGTRTTGLLALQVAGAPAVLHAPCGADCPERMVCTAEPGPLRTFPRIVGSVREPGGVAAPEPCAHPVLPDGSRCAEVSAPAAAAPAVPACRLAAAGGVFTEVPLVDRTAALGFPAPPAPLLGGGAGGTPRVRAVRVRASRFWVRGEDAALVRQDGVNASGAWGRAVRLAGPVAGLRVETLHDEAWLPGTGVEAADLVPDPANPNHVWRAAPSPGGGEPGGRFLRGHHTVAAVRVRYVFRDRTAAHGTERTREARLVVATPALPEGGTGDTR